MSSTAIPATARFGFAAFVALLVAGCGGELSAPSAVGSNPPKGPYVVTGVVAEGGVPIAGASVNAWVYDPKMGMSYSYMWVNGGVLTDAQGNFRMPKLPAGGRVWFVAYKDGYLQQCAAPSFYIDRDTTTTLSLVSIASLATSTSRPEMAGFRSVSGVVDEITPAGKRPVAGAYVNFVTDAEFDFATTRTDADGRFLLCGLPANELASIWTSVGNVTSGVKVPPGQTTPVEITLGR